MKVGDLVKYVGNRSLVGYNTYGSYVVLSPKDSINTVFTVVWDSNQNHLDIKDSNGVMYGDVFTENLILFNEALLVLSEQELTRINKLNHV